MPDKLPIGKHDTTIARLSHVGLRVWILEPTNRSPDAQDRFPTETERGTQNGRSNHGYPRRQPPDPPARPRRGWTPLDMLTRERKASSPRRCYSSSPTTGSSSLTARWRPTRRGRPSTVPTRYTQRASCTQVRLAQRERIRHPHLPSSSLSCQGVMALA